MKKLLNVLLFAVLFTVQLFGQAVYTSEDVETCAGRFSLAVEENLAEKPIGDVIVEIGKSFIGMDYEAKTLDKSIKENLVIHLTGLDCYTFMETSLAFARCIKAGNTDFDSYTEQVENLRYRDGKLDGFASRMHYVSDWINNLEGRGIVKNVTKEIGGEEYNKTINFMSTHTDAYPQLKDNAEEVAKIEKVEEALKPLQKYYIPKDKIAELEKGIHNGDLIALTTTIKGLDVVHVGVAVKQNGRVHFMHAPNVGYKVQITEKPLAEYAAGNKVQSGIIVIRPL